MLSVNAGSTHQTDRHAPVLHTHLRSLVIVSHGQLCLVFFLVLLLDASLAVSRTNLPYLQHLFCLSDGCNGSSVPFIERVVNYFRKAN